MPIGAVVGGAVIGAGGSIIAGGQAADAQRDAANSASQTSLAVANANNQLIRETRGQNIALASPFYNNGLLAGNALSDLLLGTNTYNPAVVSQPTVPGGGTFPAGALSGRTGGSGTSGPTMAQILAMKNDGVPGNYAAALAAYNTDRGLEGGGGTATPRYGPRWQRNHPGETPPTTTPPATTPPATTPPAGGTGAGAPTSALNAWDRFRQGTNYQWRLNEGANALTSNLARGTLDSGAAQKSILQYGQNFASNELGNYMNLLAQQQNVGLTAGNAVMGVSTNAANAVAAQNTNAGNAAANAALVGGQANAGMWGTIGNTAGQLGGALFQYGMGGMQPRTTTPPINFGPSSYGVGFNTSYLNSSF